jgi:hypothetical protein
LSKGARPVPQKIIRSNLTSKLKELPIRQLLYTLALATIASITGCGSKSDFAPVHGKVTLDGQPIASGAIMTMPDAGRGAQGVIKNGQFELGTNSATDGAHVGTHKVAVVAQEAGQGGPEGKAGKLLLPEKYTNPGSSGLTIEVKPGVTNTPTLELKSS